jgi:RNA polymerase sigma-70 factor (ECF subfamily)
MKHLADQQSQPVWVEQSAELGPLLARAASGDEGAWRELVSLYGRRVFALCRSRLRDRDLAEEVTQSVFVTVAIKLKEGAYAESGRFEAWLFRIAVNRVRDQVRSAGRRLASGDSEMAGSAVAPAASVGLASDELEALQSAMARLPEVDRQVVELRHQGGMPFAAIAELLDEPIGTLLARHHRALKKLKEMLTRAGPDQDPRTLGVQKRG